MKVPRKPPIRAIRGGTVARDVVTQEDLRHMANLQESEWIANRESQKASLEIEARLSHGADIEPGELTFDRSLKMARTRRPTTEHEAKRKRRAGE